jgi:hypothetical protein
MGQSPHLWGKSLVLRSVLPEGRFDSEFAGRLNYDADVMAENLTKRLVDLSGFSLAPQGDSELRLNHRKGGFDVRAFVIALHEALRVVAVQVKHLLPQGGVMGIVCVAIHLEGNVGTSVVVGSDLQVSTRQIRFVGAHFIHNEVLRGSLNQWLELSVIGDIAFGHFSRRDDVRFDAANDVAFDELALLNQVGVGVLRVHPLDKPRSRETGRVNRKVSFNRLQRQTAFFNHSLEQRGQAGILKVAGDGIVMRGFRQIALAVRVFQIASEAPTGDRAVNLESAGEDHIANGQAPTPHGLRRTFDTFAQLRKQGEKAILLVGLRFIVGRPFLLIGFLNRNCFGVGLSLTIIGVFTLDGVLDSEDVFAGSLAGLKVRAGALLGFAVNYILALASLRRNEPQIAFAGEPGFSGYFKPFLFSRFHCVSPILEKTQPEAYNSGCLGHIASAVWLNVPVGVSALTGTAKLEAGAGFEPAMAPCKEAALANLAIPPLIQISSLDYVFRLTFFIYHFNRLVRACGLLRSFDNCPYLCAFLLRSYLYVYVLLSRNRPPLMRKGRLEATQHFLHVEFVSSLFPGRDHRQNFSAVLKPSQNRMDARKWVGMLAKVVFAGFEKVSNFKRGHVSSGFGQNASDRIGQTALRIRRELMEEFVEFVAGMLGRERQHALDCEAQSSHFLYQLASLSIQRVQAGLASIVLLVSSLNCRCPDRYIFLRSHSVNHDKRRLHLA